MKSSSIILTITSAAALALSTTLLASGSETAPAKPLTLSEAITNALANNYRIEAAAHDPEIARANLLAEQGTFDPAWTTGFERSEDGSRQQVDPRVASAQSSGLYLQDRYQTGIEGTLPTGLSYELGVSTRNRRGTFNDFRDTYDAFAGLTVRQPLLRGGWADANLAGTRTARLDVEASRWSLVAEVTAVVTETVNTFNDLSLAVQSLAAARKSRDLALRLLDDNIKRAGIGVMTPLDVTSARAEAATREESVLEAERAMRQYEHALLALVSRSLAAPSPAKSPQRLTIASPPRLHPLPLPANSPQALATALDRRPDYQSALLELKKQRVQLAFEKNRELPTIDLVASFGLNGIDAGAINSLERAVNEGNTAWTLGFEASLPIPNREGRGRMASREMQLAKALVDVKRLEQSISVEIADALQSVETAFKLIEATRATRQLAQERLNAEEEKLRAGTTTTFVVLELQSNLAEAEVREIRASTSYNKAVAELDRAMGLTLERYAIRVAPL